MLETIPLAPLRPKLAAVTLLLCICLVSAAQEDPSDRETAPQLLKVWFPATLIADESDAAFQMLVDHALAFSGNSQTAVDFRIKDADGVGGIMSTIRAGKEVAPGALPDLTLINRRSFTPSQASIYLQSLETLFSSSVLNDLAGGVDFGHISFEGEQTLFGMPYLFDMLVSVHAQPLSASGYSLTFADVLSSEAEFLFPAARANGLNQTFYLQYLAAGGALPADGAMPIDEEPLRIVLGFYEELSRLGLVSPDVLTYQSPAAYRAAFDSRGDRLQLGIFSLSGYLAMLQRQELALLASKIPTADGNGASILDGWLWVIVTPDRNRQALASRFIEWMLEPTFHAGFARALHHLPSQPAILTDSLPPAADGDFFAQLLADSILPLPEAEGGAAPRLMQDALKQVLYADASAEHAARDAINQLADR